MKMFPNDSMKTIVPECDHGIVNRATDSIFCYQAWGTVARDENGVLYAVNSGFRVSHVCPFGKTVMYISRNNGKTWTPPIVINDTYLDDRDVGIVYMGNGRMVISWFTHSANVYQGVLSEDIKGRAEPAAYDAVLGLIKGYDHIPEEKKKAGSYIRVSEDYGVTWSDIIEIPVTAPHGPTLCRDGSLIYLGIETYEEDKINFRELIGNEKASLYRSVDGGYTWKRQSYIKAPSWLEGKQHLDEPHVLEMPDGTLLGAFRIEGKFTIGLTESKDGGKTWSEVRPTGFVGSPPHLMLHSSGALLCSYGRRHEPYGERVAVSYDYGKTWEKEYVLDSADDPDSGYASTVELDDGSLFTAYYQRYGQDKKPSILYTLWNL